MFGMGPIVPQPPASLPETWFSVISAPEKLGNRRPAL